MPDFRPHHTLLAHSAAITAIRYSPSGHILATASADTTVHLWDTASPSRAPFHLRSLRGHHTRGINDIAWSKDGTYLATASDDGTAVIWSVRKGVPLRVLRGHTSHVLCLAFNPKSNILATGGWDESVILWNIQRGTKIKTLQAHSDPVSSLAYNPDGTMIVTGSHDGLMRLWDATTGQCLKTIEDDQNAPISHASFTPNGQYIISSALSSTIRLWDYRHARVIKTFTGHRSTRFGCGVVVLDARRGKSEVDESAAGREVKRRRVEGMEAMEATERHDAATAPPTDSVEQALATDARPPKEAAQEPTGASGSVTEAAQPFNQARPTPVEGTKPFIATPQPLHTSSESAQPSHPAPRPAPPNDTPASDSAYIITGTDSATVIIYDLQSRRIIGNMNPRFPAVDPTEGTTAQKDTGDDDEASLAVGAHPFRREVAIGGLGDGRAVRVWRDYS